MNEIFENIYMRWDTLEPTAPQIILNTTEPAREVETNIIYSSSLVKKQYKIVNPDGSTEGWKDYEGSFKIDRKNTIIYAKGMDETEVWSKEAIYKITNIDEEQPVIKLSADLENAQQKVGIKVEVTDDTEVRIIKWAKGMQGESYFATNGNVIENNSIVQIEENDNYTFYAEDIAGNKQIYTLNIANVDKMPPVIDIQITPENTLGLETKITINYGILH